MVGFCKKNGNIKRTIPGEYDIVYAPSNVGSVSSETRDTTVSLSEGSQLPFQMLSGNFSWKQRNYILTTYVSSTEISHLVSSVVTTLERKFLKRVTGNVFPWIDVRTGFNMGNKIEIFGQLAKGDTIVVRGNEELKPGTTTSVKMVKSD